MHYLLSLVIEIIMAALSKKFEGKKQPPMKDVLDVIKSSLAPLLAALPVFWFQLRSLPTELADRTSIVQAVERLVRDHPAPLPPEVKDAVIDSILAAVFGVGTLVPPPVSG